MNSIIDTPHEQIIKLTGDQLANHPHIVFYRNLINLIDNRTFSKDLEGIYCYDFQSKFDKEIKNFENVFTKEIYFDKLTREHGIKYIETHRNDVLIELVKEDNVPSLRHLVEKGWSVTDDVMKHASLKIFAIIVESMKKLSLNCVLMHAAKHRRIEVLEKFYDKEHVEDRIKLVEAAVMHDRLEVLKWLKKYRCCEILNQYDAKHLYKIAAEKGFEKVVRWIGKTLNIIIDDSIITHVGFNGKINLLTWFTENKIPFNERMLRISELSGQIDLLEKLKQLKILKDTAEASEYPQVNEWYKANGIKVKSIETYILNKVVEAGDLDRLKILFEQFGVNYSVDASAIAYKQLHILKWRFEREHICLTNL